MAARRTSARSPRANPASADAGLGDLPLSARALRWLAARGVKRVAPPRSADETRALLAERGAPAWPALVAVETAFGGLRGEASDGREIWLGAEGRTWFGRTRKHEPWVCVAAYTPIVWYMDEAGRVYEVDDLDERFYESDSVAHRIEELAIHRTTGECFPGRQGERFAALLGLTEVVEATDSMSRAWGEAAHDHVAGVLVAEQFTPVSYGAKERAWSTWVAASSAVIRKLQKLPTG